MVLFHDSLPNSKDKHISPNIGEFYYQELYYDPELQAARKRNENLKKQIRALKNRLKKDELERNQRQLQFIIDTSLKSMMVIAI